MNLALINPKVWAEIFVAGIIVAAGWYGYNWIWDRGFAASENLHLQEKLALAEATVKAVNDTKATSDKLQADKDQLRRDKDAQITSINSTLATAIAGLRDRPARDGAGNLPVDPATGARLGATGADLSRQDGEFLAGESARANKLRANLIECQAAYGKARAALNGEAK